MDPIARMVAAGAAGAAGSGPGLYVDDLFSTFLYTGTDSTQTINNGIDLAGEGGLVWIKRRDYAYSNVLFDTERGVHKRIYSNNNSSESSNTATVTSFNSDGFSIGDNSFVNSGPTDPSGPGEHVSWTFRKAPGFFDVVTYSGSDSAQTISHNLGSVPGMILVKNLTSARDWRVYHRSKGATYTGQLNGTNAFFLNSGMWNNTEPTSTAFTVGTSSDVNGSGMTFVAYLFAHDDQSFGTSGNEAIIKCGSYTGNGSTTGPEIDLGFEPQFVLLRCTLRSGGYGGGWYLLDSMRGIPTGARDNTLQAQESNGEDGLNNNAGNAVDLDLTPTGFKITTDASSSNESGASYIYMAIRRPHKPPTAGTEVFLPKTWTGTGSSQSYDAGFPLDLVWHTYRNGSLAGSWFYDRVRASNLLLSPSTTDAEYSANFIDFDKQNSVGINGSASYYNASNENYIHHVFRRAPGFFDMVTWTGNGTQRTISHNLGVAPELIIVKARSNTMGWPTWHKSGTDDSTYGRKTLMLNTDAGESLTGWFTTDEPTSTVFSLSSNNQINSSSGYTYIGYLFASRSGVSKVGSYTGTGSNIDVNCGFTAGARFVLIKRTDSTGDWYVWDTERGIVSGNDPYLLLNSTAAEVTNTDYIDPLNAGFTVTSSAPAALNASGGTYLFLAIA